MIRVLVWVRRASQAGFLGLFLYFLFQTAFRGSFASADARVRLPLPVEGFLLVDPFVAAMTLLSTHTVYRGLLWSVGLLGLTLVFGRVFCGWICPFGTLHHFFAWIFPSRYGRGNKRVESNKTYPRQRVKYYLLYAFLAAGVTGSAVGGLFDPICIAVRAIGLAVIPAAQWIAGGAGALLGSTGLRTAQLAADGGQDFLAGTVWQNKQFYYHQTWLVGLAPRGDPLHEPLRPALLVPRALPAGRVPRRVRALRPLRHGEGPRQVHRLQPLPRRTARAPTRRRAASSGGRTSATCASTARAPARRT